MITEHTARLGEIPQSQAEARFKPFLHIDTAVRSILATAQAEMNPTPGVHVPMRHVLRRCREPIARVVKDIAITGLDLNKQISEQLKVGSRDDVKRLDRLRTNLALSVLVAQAHGGPLREHIKVVIYGDTKSLNIGSTNLVDIDLPHPTNPNSTVCLGTSIGALTNAVRTATGLNAAASGKLVVPQIIKKVRFESEPEHDHERIFRLGIEFNALTLALRDENRVLLATEAGTDLANDFTKAIRHLQSIRADQIAEINRVHITNPFEGVLKVDRKFSDTHVVFTVRHIERRSEVVITIPRKKFNNMIDHATN